MQRRAFVATALAALAASGCLGSDEQLARVSWVSLRNDTETASDAEIAILEGEETVFAEQYRLGTGRESSKVFVESPVSGAGDYTIRATVGDDERELDATAHVDGDETCIGVRFAVIDGGSFVTDLVKSTRQW
jgi:hypothetical protein